MTLLRSLTLFALLLLVALPAAITSDPGSVPDADRSTVERADALYEEGSFRAALKLYLQAADTVGLDDSERTRLQLRIADCSWRDWAATQQRDQTQLEEARKALREMIAAVPRAEDRDRNWAEAQESLGDSFWIPQQTRNWYTAWNHYQQALAWWAGSTDLDLARGRYLGIIRKSTTPPDPGPWHYYGQYGNQLPLDILEQALSIAETATERAHLNYQMAMTLRYQGGEWRDDAIFQYAQWLAQTGRVELDEQGNVTHRPDYVEAVARYRQLLAEFSEGESRWYRQAQQEIRQIVDPRLDVAVSNTFLPESEVRFALGSRNVGRIDLSLTSIDLSGKLFRDREGRHHDWLAQLDLTGRERIADWTVTHPDHRDHRPSSDEHVIEHALAPGAYILEARAEGQRSRALVLVTDLSVVIKTAGKRAIVYVCDALDGSPVPGANVHLWQLGYNRHEWHWDGGTQTTDENGLTEFELARDGHTMLAGVRAGERQALGMSGTYRTSRADESWHVYTFSDRPAYRPGETAKFKVITRAKRDGSYRTPSGEVLEYTIRDARRNELAKGELTLNEFGSAWGELELQPDWALGEVHIEFRVPSRKTGAGQFPLFRIEEYKLPEFTVNVETPLDETGRRKVFVLGDTIEASIVAEYTFGGPVAGATVEVLVHQSSYFRRWTPQRPYPWFYEESSNHSMRWYYGEQTIHRETLTTDSNGRAIVSFTTPFGQNQDFEYRIEARVTDASRREIVGQDTVRVGRRSYFATLQPEHNLYRPGDKVTIEINTRDANDEPVAVRGRVTVVKQTWTEREHRPASYEEREVLSVEATTGKDGTAEIDFEAATEGYYRIRWFSRDRDGAPVRGDTTVWVCDASSRHIGYHHGGVDLLIDRDTARAGETLPVMISVPVSNRWVLLTVEAEGILEHRLVHVEDRVRLVELDVDDRFVPNVYLAAAMVHDLRVFFDQEQLIVPPVEHFLDVRVEYDRDRYLPRQDGTVTVLTRDVDGDPVSAEVALALVDKSVFYIQSDYAGDPRQVYFGNRRSPGVQTGTSLQMQPYLPIDGREEENETKSKNQLGKAGLADRDQALRMVANFEADAVMESAAQAPGVAAKRADGRGNREGAAPDVEVRVRTDFRSTVLWLPDLVTGADGRATVDVTFPESLTTWQLKARVATRDDAFGIAEADVRTNQPVIMRLQNPRFLVVGDRAVISGIVRNDSEEEMTFDASLEVDGVRRIGRRPRQFSLKPGEETRLDWAVIAESAGTARLTAKVTAGSFGDAMRREIPVLEHGIHKQIARAARLADGVGSIVLDLPAERRPGSTSMIVQVTPSLAVTMLDALPYLIDYPYGCTEQTMSRFLPAAIVARTFEDLGIDPDEAMHKVYGGIERQFVDKTHPHGKGRDLDRATRKGLKRLYDMQHGDGGWGWWKEGDSDAYMTAYVVWGLSLAKDAGIRIEGDAISRGVEFLRKRIVEFESSPDMQSFMLFALASANPGSPHRFENVALEGLWERRERLNAYTRALLALAAHEFGRRDMAETLVRNLENGVKIDDDPANSTVQRGSRNTTSRHDVTTAHWGADGFWWRWSEGPVETTAFVLRAMLAIDPDNALIPPATSWLIQNRRGAQWSNTRDTAIAVLALTDYLRATDEIRGRHGFAVEVNGRAVETVTLGGAELITAPSRFTIDPAWLRAGENRIEVRRTTGSGPLYVMTQATFFSLEEPIAAAGHQLFVRRQYNRIVARETLLNGPRDEKTPLLDGGELASGDRVEVVLTIEAKNDYEYLVFEDLKPAGLEAIDVRSGGPLYASELKPSAVELRLEGGVDRVDLTGASRWVYRELRDRKVALFIDKLPQGVWEIRYTLRAETPGEFHALPFQGHAMYVPEIRANGVEQRVNVFN
ncbi:MAG: alpha-2-macroglobulin [Acidobacteria bacterium]|nr:alpha-2-macroglobulin [Acidobacteriota bacterium]NIM63821.1 alpha-2-macroglobulin [Acidobacteriota bacterium]NIO59755.1 alpha-2-macroglobulin [Acidobacteriota bacterium]NIQ30838.1 alpha-2-macroglobulin [Acidobacteriota bacterium]NIQ85911.1 alpha-2-macroglobulin [Acidobacteriota bacterium]